MRAFEKISKMLRENIRIQEFLTFVPLFLISFYIAAYTVDLMSNYKVIMTNDNYMQQDNENGNLYKVDSVVKEDDVYHITVKGNHVLASVNTYNYDAIYECHLTGNEYKPYNYRNIALNDDFARDPFIIIESFSESGSTIKYSVNDYYSDNKELRDIATTKDAIVYTLYKWDKGYKVEFYDRNGSVIAEEEIEQVPNIEKRKDPSYEGYINITDGFDVFLREEEYSLCSKLATPSVYYSVSGDALLKNVPIDYYLSFIRNSNMYVVVGSLGFFLVLYIFCNKSGDFVVLGKKRNIILCLVLFALMIVLVFITYSLLGVFY